jgi:hypothetical protein
MAESSRLLRAGRTARGQCNRGIAGNKGVGRADGGGLVGGGGRLQYVRYLHVHRSTYVTLPHAPIQPLAGGQRGNVLEGWEIVGQIRQMGRWCRRAPYLGDGGADEGGRRKGSQGGLVLDPKQ